MPTCLPTSWNDVATPAPPKTLGDVDELHDVLHGHRPKISGLTDDIFAWRRRVHPRLAPDAPHHEDALRWCESIEPGVRPRPEVDVWPRGHGKSSTVETGVSYLAEREKRSFCMYVCETQESAERHVENIKTILERIGGDVGRRLENQYGNSRGWKRSMFRTASGFSAIALGLDVAMRGIKIEDMRPDLIVFDDIDGRHDSSKIIKKKIETITNSILPAGSKDVAIWGIQNLITPNGIFSQLVDGRAEFLARRRVNGPIPAVEGLQTERRLGKDTDFDVDPDRMIAVITGGTPTWPGRMDLEACQNEILSLGYRAFERECQNDVTEVEGALWTQQLLNDTRVSEAPELTKIVVGYDPATTGKTTSDETGIAVCGIDPPHGYVLESVGVNAKPKVAARRAVQLHDKYGAAYIFAESNQGGEMVRDSIETAAKQMHEEGLRGTPAIKVILDHVSDGKRVRAEPVHQLYDENLIHHVGAHDALEKEQTTWDASSGDESPNLIDASVAAFHNLMLGRKASAGGFTSSRENAASPISSNLGKYL